MFRSLPLQVGVDAGDLAVALVLVGAAVVLGYRAVAVVDEGERGVLFASGSVRRVLESGYHLVSPVGSRVEHVDVRRELARPASQWSIDVEAVDVRSVYSGERTGPSNDRARPRGVDHGGT